MAEKHLKDGRPTLRDLLLKPPLTTAGVATFSVNTYSDGVEKPLQGPSKKHDNSIDEMASALLDNTSIADLPGSSRKPGLGIAEGTHIYASTSTTALNKPQLAVLSLPCLTPSSAVPVHGSCQPDILRHSPPGRSPNCRRPSRVEKQSPAIPRKSSKRRAKRIPRPESVQIRKDNGLTRPLPQSKTVAWNLGREVDVGIPSSTSVPLAKFATQMHGHIPENAEICGEEINEKVMIMLAATESLKPSPVEPSQGPSKMFRMKPSRVFAKVSHALERFHTKGGSKESKVRGKITHPVAPEFSEVLPNLDPLPLAAHESPISSIEIRLNEGDNLNKKKVQKMVGEGLVPRKPVSRDGKSLRSAGSSDDPFSEVTVPGRTPTKFENKLKIVTGSDEGSLQQIPADPFETEIEFDNDLNGILNCTPLGCSTPRIRVHRALSLEESPTKRAKGVSIRGGASAMTLCAEEEIPRPVIGVHEGREYRTGDPGEKTVGEGARRLRRNFVELSLSIDDDEPKRMKKHPSPSKETLESLEREFRDYAREQIKRAATPEDRDELASSFEGLMEPLPLAPRDRNQLLTERLALHNGTNKLQSSTLRKCGSSQRQSSMPSRIPRLVDKPRPKIRYGLMCYPITPEAMEVDELQWDITPVVGMGRV